MCDIKIYNDFLSDEQYSPIYQYFLDNERGLNGDSVPWYWVNGVTTMGDGNIQFISLGYANYQITNMIMFNVLAPIIHKIKPIALHRVKANLTLSKQLQPIDEEKIYHVDNDFCTENKGVMTTGIYYVNTNDGYTLFEDGTKVESVANRFVTFPCHIKHGGMPYNNDKFGRRIVVNFNWI